MIRPSKNAVQGVGEERNEGGIFKVINIRNWISG